jgi:hypothetical protein
VPNVDYETIANYFLIPNGTEPTSVSGTPSTPARELRDAVEAIATIGWWSRAASDAFTALGHGFFDGYAWGRAASLGPNVNPSVIVSAFGVFSSGLLVPVIKQARTISSAEAILAARATGAAQGLAAATSAMPTDVITQAGDRLLAVLQHVEPGPRHLFGALQSLPVPSDPHGRLWRAAELFREHRGDGHLAACVTFGLDMVEMNVLTERWLGYPVGEYSSTRGFAPEDLARACERFRHRGWMAATSDELTQAGRVARDEIEALTDASQQQVVDALGDDLPNVVSACETVSAAILSAHAAPADPRKRAAG